MAGGTLTTVLGSVRPGSTLTGLAALLLIQIVGPAESSAQPTVANPAKTASDGKAKAKADSARLPSDAPLPSCLDQSIRDELGQRLRPKGVQKRFFQKDKHLQLIGHGGVFAADLASTSYLYGGALAFFFTEDLGLELRLDRTPVALDLDAPVAEFFGDDRFEPGTSFVGMASLLWSPIHAKLKMAGSIVHSDILFAFGAGRLFHDSVQGVTFNAGLILEMYLTKWFTTRFDFRNYIAVQEAVAETRLTNNFVVTAGIAFWIPTPL